MKMKEELPQIGLNHKIDVNMTIRNSTFIHASFKRIPFPRALVSISFLHLRFIRALGVNLLSREGARRMNENEKSFRSVWQFLDSS